MAQRIWLLIQGEGGRESVLLSGELLQQQGVHPLRCVYLGRFAAADDPAAVAKGREIARATPAAAVIARNVRVAVDRRQTKRWRLSEQELDLLRAGEHLQIRDRLGTFSVGWSAGD